MTMLMTTICLVCWKGSSDTMRRTGTKINMLRSCKWFLYGQESNDAGVILCMCSANERRRYNVTSSLIGWAHSQNDPCDGITWCPPHNTLTHHKNVGNRIYSCHNQDEQKCNAQYWMHPDIYRMWIRFGAQNNNNNNNKKQEKTCCQQTSFECYRENLLLLWQNSS